MNTHPFSSNNRAKRRLIVGISGASGAILGIRMLEYLSQGDEIETHLILRYPPSTLGPRR